MTKTERKLLKTISKLTSRFHYEEGLNDTYSVVYSLGGRVESQEISIEKLMQLDYDRIINIK